MIFKKKATEAFVGISGTGTVKEVREETLRMFSIADMAVAGAVALLLFGPDQLPKVARRAGQLVRDVQNTSQAFIREMERAADIHDAPAVEPYTLPPPAAPLYHETPEPAPHDLVAGQVAPPTESSVIPTPDIRSHPGESAP